MQGSRRRVIEIAIMLKEKGPPLLSGLLARSGATSLAHFLRSTVDMDPSAAHAVYSLLLHDCILTAPQICFNDCSLSTPTEK